MAKIYDNEIDKTVDWGGDEHTSGLPVKGKRVQDFIKNQLEKRIGVLHYDTSNNRYLAFADETNRDIYLNDTSRNDLLLGAFDAPFNYTASIKLISPQKKNIFAGTEGNYIEFEFDTYNKEGLSVGEDVLCTFKFVRGTTKQEVTAKYKYQEKVKFLIDSYLLQGTNTITISIQGQTTFAATSVAVVYGVIDLSLTDEFDISRANRISDSNTRIEVPYTISGQGIKEMEWYINGVQQEYVKDEDEVVESTASRTKYLDITNLSSGVNALQMRAYTTVDGEKFYTDTLYREFFVVEDSSEATLLAVKATVPSSVGLISEQSPLKFYGADQYVAYKIEFAVYNPANPVSTPVEIYVGGNLESTVNVANGVVESFSYTPYLPQSTTVKLVVGEHEISIPMDVTGSSMNIAEITNELMLDFRASGRNNSSPDKNRFSYEGITGTFTGFLWNPTSGWVDNMLKINEGASLSLDFAPLGNDPTKKGRTIEMSLKTIGVSDDNAVVCTLLENGVGLKITASEAVLMSRESESVSTKFKSEEDVRISFVINRKTGSTNKGLAFIYINGVLSGATHFSTTDSFESSVQLIIAGTEKAEVGLKQIRIYDTALSSDQILNNYILYQDTATEMNAVYYRNDVTEDSSQNLSIDKLEKFLPVMLITGNIPVLENTNNKKEQITVDIDYVNLQDPQRSFTMKKAAMTPQGTSSMSYPKKNFRIYTKKIDDTKVYDWQGNEIEDKLYSFKENAQRVKTWCLKADYAESSGTHNTGIARLWNKALYNAQIDGEYKLRTAAQVAALQNGFTEDVRTTVDGFPILMFYRLTEDSDIVFIGKYNFNNDKSTESVFGFKDIPGFDNSRMQCWEVLNNGNHLALFTDVDNWDTEWTDAFEARYPDAGDAADTTDLKAFAQWLVGVKDDADTFATQKWEHLDVYKTAAYYVYLMRFGAVDQTVKNAMLTSEDGTHFFFINYDNDTINGVRNDGLLIYPPTIDRQTLDESYSTPVYAYAGHDSVLWNRLEADAEFMSIVSVVDNALYQSGLRYDDVITMFDTEQCEKWCEKIYNQDAQYKYIGPFVNDGIDNLFMLQGSRKAHRRWWLSRRFGLMDSLFVSGAYKSNVLECKLASAPAGIQFGITAGYDMNYGYGVNNIAVDSKIALTAGQSHTFTTKQVLNIGDPMRIYAAHNLSGVDLSGFVQYLSTLNVASVMDKNLGTKLKSLILGDGTNVNTSLSEIQGLSSAQRLETLNIEGFKGIASLDLSKSYYLKSLYAKNSGLKSVQFAEGAQKLSKVQLPSGLQSLALRNLVSLKDSGVTLEGNGAELLNVEIVATPGCSTFQLAQKIMGNATNIQSFTMDNINWKCTADELLALVEGKDCEITFGGKVTLDAVDQDIVNRLQAAFGSSCFDKASSFYIIAPDSIFITGASEVLEGDSAQYKAVVFSQESGKGTTTFKITNGSRVGTTLDSSTGLLTTTENGNSDATLTIMAQYLSPAGKVSSKTMQVAIKKRTYPTSAQVSAAITGEKQFSEVGTVYKYTCELTGFTGRFSGVEWSISGDIAEYVSIQSQLNGACSISLDKDVEEFVSGTLTVTFTKLIGGTISGTYELSAVNENIAISSSTNLILMELVYSYGWAAHKKYMTKTECALVTDNQLAPYKFRNVTTFHEFQYFTSITKIPQYCFASSMLTEITFPESLQTIDQSAFYRSYNLQVAKLVFPSKLTTVGTSAFADCIGGDYFEFPENLVTVGTDAFPFFTEIVVNDKCTSQIYRFNCSIIHIGAAQQADTNAIILTRSYTKFYNDSNNTNYLVYDNQILISTNTLLYVTADKKEHFSEQDWDFIITNSTRNINHNSSIYPLSKMNYNGTLTIPADFNYNYTRSILCGATVDTLICNSNNTPAFNKVNNLYLNGTTNYTHESAFGKVGNLYIGKNMRFKKIQYTITNINIDAENPYITINSGIIREASNGSLLGIYYNPTGQYEFHDNYSSLYSAPQLRFDFDFDSLNIILDYTETSGNVNFLYVYLPTYCDTICVSGNVEIFNINTINCRILQLKNSAYAYVRSDVSSFIWTDLQKVEFSNKSSFGKLSFSGCTKLKEIVLNIDTAESMASTAFGTSESNYTGRDTYSTGDNILYVPADSTGYDEGVWADVLCNPDKCGFTLSKTL